VVNVLPAVSVNSGSICSGTIFTMTPGGASTYVYSNGASTVMPLSNESFTVTGTDANGCKAIAVSDVTVNTLPVISVSGGTICSGSVYTLSPSGAATYSYAPSLTATVNPTSTTSYSISGTDANGCKSITDAVAEVTVFALPALSVNSGSICAGAVFTITASNSTLLLS